MAAMEARFKGGKEKSEMLHQQSRLTQIIVALEC